CFKPTPHNTFLLSRNHRHLSHRKHRREIIWKFLADRLRRMNLRHVRLFFLFIFFKKIIKISLSEIYSKIDKQKAVSQGKNDRRRWISVDTKHRSVQK